jgi:hypothetical protein
VLRRTQERNRETYIENLLDERMFSSCAFCHERYSPALPMLKKVCETIFLNKCEMLRICTFIHAAQEHDCREKNMIALLRNLGALYGY